ncbi:MAG TPA: amino acid ABC transporter substrate-binding protein [Hyphomicrobiaceae bacterium]|nr:amino acid ABC transporter substrate-binding protein [Hyphomicrobiaceae bacterium]
MKRSFKIGAVAAAAAIAFTGLASAQTKPTLEVVKARGAVACGVGPGTPGFSNPDDKGNWTGFDVDFCRAVAAAIFNDPKKVAFKPLTAKERFTALQSGEVDLLSRTTTWTAARDSAMNLAFVGVMYYDGQGFMVNKKLGVKSAKELNGAAVCVATGTTTELNLSDYFRSMNMTYKPVVFEKSDEINAAYQAGRCDVYTTDASSLYAQRLRMQKPEDHVILPEIISKEPLGPLVRQADWQWFTLNKWVYFALLNAEELGVTSANVDKMLADTKNPEIMRLLGRDKETDFGKPLGLTQDWVVRIIKGVGNYEEIYERNVGPKTPLKIARGVNNLWTKGGLQYAPPIR